MKIIIYLAIFLPSLLLAQSPPQLFAQAVAAQQKADNQLAINLYDSILAQGWFSTELYHNLALAYHEQQNTGKAVLFLQKSLVLNPNNLAALHNLKVLQQRIKDPVKPLPFSVLGKIIHNFSSLFSSNGWAIIFLGLNLWIIIIWSWLKKNNYIAAAFILLTLSTLGAAYYQKNKIEQVKKAVLIKNFALRSSPSPAGEELLTVSEGETMQILTVENEWFKVVLSDGMQGWLPAMSLETV